jgi:Fe-S cluster assembly protein SufD
MIRMTVNQSINEAKYLDQDKKTLRDFVFTKDDLPLIDHVGLQKYRQTAWEAYQTLQFPDLKDEAWRRTDIRQLQTEKFSLENGATESEEPPNRFLNPIAKGNTRSGQIITGSAKVNRTLDEDLEAKGVIFSDFSSFQKEYPDLLAKFLGKVVDPTENKFTALAAALADDGVVLYVPKNVVIDKPLQSLYWGSGTNLAYFNHLIIWLEEGSRATFVHESASYGDANDHQMFHDGIVEIYVGENARLNFVELQSWGKNVWSFSQERAHVMANGKLDWVFGAIGTHLTKNFSTIDLLEPGAKARMSGFYFADGLQHLDHDTRQNHHAKDTVSDLLFKGALLDQGRSVWRGMIYVAPGAIGTDGYQANKNLILSKAAHADSIPGLEILADDVRCTHGATVGNIDQNELFYLLSRGIPKKEAEQLIVMGFYATILERIPFEGIQNRFLEAIREKMADK